MGIKFANSAPRLYSAPKVHYRAEESAPVTLGDNTISLLGTATGNLNDGIVVTTANGNNDGVILSESISEAGKYYEFTVANNEDY